MPLHPTRRCLIAALALLPLGAGPARARADVPVIAAASDLQFAIAEIAAAFTAETGMRVRLALGSTGNFARQIRAGAPFELFMAADEQFIIDLHTDGLTRDAGSLYAIGRLALVAPPGGALVPDDGLDGLAAMLQAGQITRFAIANPEHAPYGMRAREALITRGLWDRLRPALVMGENVSQAAAFALSGNAQGGIIALSLALAPPIAARARHALIPDAWHQPLRQRMALMRNAGPVAQAFHDYLSAPPARATLARHGFVLPEGG